MSGKDPKRISEHTEKKAGDYLFSTGEMTESQGLDFRTRIKSEAMFNALTFYGILAEGMGSDKAQEIKDMIERMLVASGGGMGRAEAVDVLRQNFPKKVTIAKGREEIPTREE